MKKKIQTFGSTTIVAVLTLGAISARAVGYRAPNQDTEAVARGNAFTATADNPSAIYYNPAGIAQLDDQNISLGFYAVSLGIDYTSPTGSKSSVSSDPVFLPQVYYTITPKEFPLSFGLGIYSPYGLSLDWGDSTPFRTVAEKATLAYVTVNPVVAWKILPNLSLAVGPTFNYSYANFQQGIGILPNDTFKLKGDGWGYGFNAGVMWEPIERWSLGLSYRYTTTVKYTGTAETSTIPALSGSTSSTAEITFPQYVVAGVSFRPTEDWNFEIDIDWTDWDNVNQITVKNTPLGDTAIILNYRSSFMYEAGVTRQLGKGWFASAGYFFSENSSPDADFSPTVPDSYLHVGSAGVGHKGRTWDWALAYQIAYNPGREVTGDTTNPTANGTYKFLYHAVSLSATLKF